MKLLITSLFTALALAAPAELNAREAQAIPLPALPGLPAIPALGLPAQPPLPASSIPLTGATPTNAAKAGAGIAGGVLEGVGKGLGGAAKTMKVI